MRLFPVYCLFLLSISSCSSKDDEPTAGSTSIKVSIADISIDEGSSDTNVFVRMSLSAPASELITVFISTEDGTAEANTDYTPFENVPIVFEIEIRRRNINLS